MKYDRMIWFVCVFVCLLSCILPAAAVASDQLIDDIAIVNTQWSSYSNANWINDLAFDPDGSLWAATSGGAVRWDTETGAYCKYTSEYGLCSNQLSAVATAADGTIWLASLDNGISRLQSGKLTNFTVDNGLPSNVIYDIAVANDGVVWAVTDWDICSFDGQRWQTYADTPLKDAQVIAKHVVCAPNGSVWFGTNFKGVFRLSEAGWTHFNEPAELASITNDLSLGADGSVWATLLSADLARYTDDHADIITLETNAFLAVDCIYIGTDGAIWLANWGDIIRVKDNEWQTFTGDHTQDIDTTCIIEGPDGTIWCGGFMGGLAGYKNGEWTVLQTDDWLPDNNVNKVIATQEGGLWILTSTAVTYYDGETAQVYPTQWNALDMLIAPDQSVWISLGNNGVYRFNGSQWIFCGPGDTQDGFEDNSFGAMLADLESVMGDDFEDLFGDIIGDGFPGETDGNQSGIGGNDAIVAIESTQRRAGVELDPWYLRLAITPDGRLLCVSADETVHSLFHGTWSVYDTPGDSIADIVVSQQDVYWLSCYEGLYRSTDGNHWTYYPAIIDPNYLIYHHGSLYITPDDTCWISSLSGLGCQPAKGDSFYFQKGDGIPNQNVSCVTGTPDGDIWIGTTYIAAAENGAGAGWYHDGTWHILTASDGLASNAVHDIFTNGETVWLGTNGGISVYTQNSPQ